jgi:hypothetical protein
MSILAKRLLLAGLGAVALIGAQLGISAAADLSVPVAQIGPLRAHSQLCPRLPQTYPPAVTYLCPPTIHYEYTPPPLFVATPYGPVYLDHPNLRAFGP